MKHLTRTLRNLLIGAAVVVPAWLASPAVSDFLSHHAATASYVALAGALLEAIVHAVRGGTGAGGA